MVARNRVGIGLLYGLPGNIGGIHSFESIPGLHKRLKICALYIQYNAYSSRILLNHDFIFSGGGGGGGGNCKHAPRVKI
jgi:hypothetical protein